MSDENKSEPYSKEELKELFEGVKEGLAEKHPEIADKIKLCTKGEELDAVLAEYRAKTSTQTDNKPAKTLGVVKHVHEIMEKPKEDTSKLNEGGESLDSTGGQIELQNWRQKKPKSWESHEQMLDDLFKMETLAKIEATRAKPNREVIEKGEKATSMIEKLYKSGMQSGRLSRASKDLMRGRFVFEEPEWFRKKRNPLGTKKLKEKPVLVESL